MAAAAKKDIRLAVSTLELPFKTNAAIGWDRVALLFKAINLTNWALKRD